jgi:hypothetical protein
MGPRGKQLARHYLEMVVAMFGGMAVLGLSAGGALGAFGSGWQELTDDAPAAMLGVMPARPAEYAHGVTA